MPKYKCINETIRCRHVSKNKKLAIQIELVVNIEKKTSLINYIVLFITNWIRNGHICEKTEKQLYR